MPLDAGTRLGSYEILAPLGAGGMGEVYRARDTDLNRLVAIKVLPDAVAADPIRLSRFKREAQLASSLNHPNIITIHQIGQAGSVSYIAMELIDGETLAGVMASGALPLGRVADVAAQMASGLSKAHDAGIVHRDLKPQNVMLTKDGLVKVLDFGLSTVVPPAFSADAETVTAPLTSAGAILGTVYYMSPEQASGRLSDFRSDQFSFGAVLYEMVTGRRPFSAPTAVQTLAGIIDAAPQPIAAINPDVPEALQRIVERCLAKRPEERYGSTQDLVLDLQAVRDQRSQAGSFAHVPRAPVAARRLRLWWMSLVGLLLLAIAAVVVVPSIRQRLLGRPVAAPGPGTQRLAVLPFSNVGNDPANQPFVDGLVDVLTSQLTQVSQFDGALDIVPASDVLHDKTTSAREANKAYGVSRVINGSVQRTAKYARVVVNLIDAGIQKQIDGRSIDLPLEDVGAMQDGVVRAVAAMLGTALRPEAQQALTVGSTTRAAAYDLYLQARGYLQRHEKLENVDHAVELFRRAVQLDPTFALGHAGLGEAHWRKYELTKDAQWAGAARENCTTALGYTDRLAPVYATLGLIDEGTGRYEDAVNELTRATKLDPTSGDAYRELANTYRALGKIAEAESTYKTAIQVRPNYWANYNALGVLYRSVSRYPEAVKQFQKVIELTPDNARGYRNLGVVYYDTGQYDLAARQFEQSTKWEPSERAYSNLGTVYFLLHDYAAAARQGERALKLNDHDSQIWSNLAAAYYWAPDERGKARAAYEKALELAKAESRVNPRDAALVIRMADCQSMLGHPAEARTLIDRAAGMPLDKNTLFSAGEVYEQLGDRSRALDLINNALAQGYSRDVMERSPGLEALRADTRLKRK